MESLLTLRKHDEVTLKDGHESIDGFVTLASPNCRSLAVSFTGIMAGFVGTMPLFWTGDHYETLTGHTIAVAPRLTCALCGDKFNPAWTDEEALVEMRKNFGDVDRDQIEVVCDDCYQIMVLIDPPSGYNKD
jgi:hypothetical protein